MLDFFKSSSGARSSSPLLLDTGDDGPDGRPAVKKKVPLRYIVI